MCGFCPRSARVLPSPAELHPEQSVEMEMSTDKLKQKKSEFDADVSPRHPINKEAAKVHNLRFNKRKQAYVDSDGCLIRDKFGQPL
jgi:hypothetical protein